MNYKLVNKTKFSTKKLKQIINFVCPPKLKNFRFTIKYGGGGYFEGHANTQSKSIVIKICDKIKFPQKILPKRGEKFGYIDRSMIKNTNELFVSLFAHELRHLWQFFVSKQNFKKVRYVYMPWYGETFYFVGPRIEKDASKYSRKMLLKYRNLEDKI